MQTYKNEKAKLKSLYVEVALNLFNKELGQLNPYELNAVIAAVVKRKIMSNWGKVINLHSEQRVTIYFSMEWLIGKVVLDALNSLGLLEITKNIFKEEGIDIMCLEEVDDAALGNGGLGRLAACFADSAATQGYPMYGVGLYYKFGLFKQTFSPDGHQVEVPDDWTANGDPWSEPNYDEAVIIQYRYTKIMAVPRYMPVIGYRGNPDHIDLPLKLWMAVPIEGTDGLAAKISDYLYPDDNPDDGKRLRIMQEHFFVSAELRSLVNIHLQKHGHLDNFEEYYIFQMNDTHPVLGCLEFIRILKEHGYTFDEAFEKAKKCFAYTNHTVLSEALEKWPIHIFKDLLPELYKVIQEMNMKLIHELLGKKEFHVGQTFAGVPMWNLINQYELFDDRVENLIYMSRIACYVGNHINGVAEVHTGILQDDLLANWYNLYPERFCNITNGVTPRRWIMLANPYLSEFLDKYIGTGWRVNLRELEKLEQYKDNHEVLAELAGVKHKSKVRLAKFIEKHEKNARKEPIIVNPEWNFDCQVKRIHEYKRQDMNVLRILYFYEKLKKGELRNFPKTVFIIGGKAAASYGKAKMIIALIKDVQEMVNSDPDVNDKMQVVFLTNYNVSYGEIVYPAANFSEQISTAGKEASGTGNMKFMMNGAPTIGTMDGANIEIVEEASIKNNFIFGADVAELETVVPSMYNHQAVLEAHPELEGLIEYLEGKRNLRGTYNLLAKDLRGNDKYFVMYDLKRYIDVTLKAFKAYYKEQTTGDLSHYTRKSLKNIAHSGKFSSDRTIQQYAEEIWHIEKVRF